MDSRAAPTATNNDSRLSHQKRLHFILFVDAAQTRSFSLKTRHAWWLLTAILLFFVSSIGVGVGLVRTYKKLKTTQSYLIDVKRELLAQSIAERNILSPEFIGGGYKNEKTDLIQAIVDELGQTTTTPSAVVAKKDTKSIKKLETASQQKSEAPQAQTDNTSAKPATAEHAVVLPPTTTAATAARPMAAEQTSAGSEDGSPIKFENVAVADDDDEPGTINISFDLQNVSGRMLTGWVCAAVLLKNSEGHNNMRAAPSSVSLEPNKQSIASCKGGEFVKFSRLRPTVLSTSGTQSGVEKVVVYFTDGTSGRQYAHKSSK